MEPKVGEIWDMNDDIYGLVLITKVDRKNPNEENIISFSKLPNCIVDYCGLFWFDIDYRKTVGVCKPPINLTSNLSKLIFIGE